VWRLIIESAYSFIDNRRFKETHSFPELLLRYGLTDRVELRLGGNYEVGGEAAVVSGAVGREDPFASRDRLLYKYTVQRGEGRAVRTHRVVAPECNHSSRLHSNGRQCRYPKPQHNWPSHTWLGGNCQTGCGSTLPCVTSRQAKWGIG
jgi:hypothetical protein